MSGKNSGGVVVGIGIAALMLLSSFGGYKFVTAVNPEVDEIFNTTLEDQFGIEIKRDVKEKDPEKDIDTQKDTDTENDIESNDSYQEIVRNSEYKYKAQNTRTYSGPTIDTAATHIFNSEGKVLDDFYEEGGYSLDLSLNVDSSEAVYLKDKTLYYIDADLGLRVIEKDVEGAEMCYEGRYFYYTKIGDSYLRDVYIYDLESDSATKVAQTNLNNVAISPDGQTIAYFLYTTDKEFYVCSIGQEPKLIKSGLRVSPLTVSNDAETVFYESIDENDGIYCYDNDKTVKISKEYFYNAFFDRDCKQILYEEPGKVKYYKAGDTSTVTLFDSSYMDYKICNAKKQRTGLGLGHYIIDTDCFADVLLISETYNYYTLKGETPVLFNVASSEKDMYGMSVTLSENGPVCYYEKEAHLYRSVYNGSQMEDTVLLDGEDYVEYKAISEKGDEIWFTKHNDQGLYYSVDGSEPVKVADGISRGFFNLQWNPQDGKCYYISEGKLHSVYDSMDSIVDYDIEAKEFIYPHSDDRVLCYKNAEGKELILINGEAYPYK